MSATETATKTSIAALKPQPMAQEVSNLPQVSVGFNTLQSFELAQRAAKLLSMSTLVPKEYQGNLPNCVIALNMSARIGADPLLVMQNLYVVHGRPGWSAQFTIACFNQCGRFSAMRYQFTGTEGKDDWSCQAYAIEKETGEKIFGPIVSIGMAKKEGWYGKNGSKWQTIPQLMLMYRAGAWLARTHAPEISMGLQTQEELHDVYDARQAGNGQFAVDLDDLRPTGSGAAIGAGAEPQVLQNGGNEPTASDPQFSDAEAIEYLKGAGTAKNLEERWKDVVADYIASKRDLSVEVEAARNERREALAGK